MLSDLCLPCVSLQAHTVHANVVQYGCVMFRNMTDCVGFQEQVCVESVQMQVSDVGAGFLNWVRDAGMQKEVIVVGVGFREQGCSRELR